MLDLFPSGCLAYRTAVMPRSHWSGQSLPDRHSRKPGKCVAIAARSADPAQRGLPLFAAAYKTE